MGSLLVVTGPPGAGKSTVSRLLADSFERSVLVEGDAFFGFLAAGAIEPWLPESNAQNEVVTDVAGGAAGTFAQGGYDVVYDGIVGAWFLDRFLEATGLDGLDYVVLLPTEDECVRRVEGRTGHGFTDEAAARHMHRQFNERTVARQHILDGGLSPGDVVGEIRALRATGTLRWSQALAT